MKLKPGLQSDRSIAPLARALRVLLAATLLGFLTQARADDVTIRIGVLPFGTVSWGLDELSHRGFDREGGFKLELVPMAASNAAQIALLAGTVDVITSDWLWVARNLAEGRRYQFAPGSTALGALDARPDSGINTLADLRGRELGVAGTGVDKSWLLLRAYARQQAKLDLAKDAKPSFAAPPALNELMLRGKLPAVLNFWPYSARLHAAGMKRLLDLHTVLAGLGMQQAMPMIGWVFSESWALKQRPVLLKFLDAVHRTDKLLRDDDSAWPRLRPLMKAANDAEFLALRDAYREGVDPGNLAVDPEASRKLYALLAAEGGEELVGKSRDLDAATFFNPDGAAP